MRRSRFLLALLLVFGLPWRADAQGGRGGKSILLQIKPRPGDTLRMRLDQETEMNAVRRSASSESNATMISRMKMFSRTIVDTGSDGGPGTSVVAVTDSLIFSSTDDNTLASMQRVGEEIRGQRVRYRVFPDGTVGMSGIAQQAPRDVAEVVSLMPAAFPKEPVAVGESWIREMPLPMGTQFASPLSAKLHVTFRLDSTARGGDLAYVSMRGEMQHLPGPPAPSSPVLDRGSVTGTMLVDRRRGWLVESRFNILLRSTVTPLVSGAPLTQMQVRVTQHMVTMDRR